MENKLFRQKTIDKLSTPDELTDYLKVTRPGTWMLLAGIVILMTGIIVWGFLGHIESWLKVECAVQDGNAYAYVSEDSASRVKSGMKVVINDKECTVDDAYFLEGGRLVVKFQADVPDGKYDIKILTESLTPVSFLFD